MAIPAPITATAPTARRLPGITDIRRPSWPTPNVVVVQEARTVQVPTQVYVPVMYVQRADGYYVPYTYPRSGCGC